MTMIGSAASFFLKKASSADTIKKLLLSTNIYIGGALYVLTALINIYILKYLEYTIVLPLTSITYIWTMILSYFLLGENVGKKKIIGVIGIVIGSIILVL